jgi:hypothetical protein
MAKSADVSAPVNGYWVPVRSGMGTPGVLVAVSERLSALADGPRWRVSPGENGWDVVIWLRTPSPAFAGDYAGHDAIESAPTTPPGTARLPPAAAPAAVALAMPEDQREPSQAG